MDDPADKERHESQTTVDLRASPGVVSEDKRRAVKFGNRRKISAEKVCEIPRLSVKTRMKATVRKFAR